MKRGDLNLNSKLLLGTLLIIILIIVILFSQTGIKTTGNIISEEQPDATLGKDTYIRENLDLNFNTFEILKVGRTTSGSEMRALLEFNFSNIPSTDTILNASLELNLIGKNYDNPITFEIYRIISPWNKTLSTWFKKDTEEWMSPGADYGEKMAEITMTSELGKHSIDITNMTRKWIDGSRLNYGMLILPKNIVAGEYFDFASSQSTESEKRPKVTINHMKNAPPTITTLKTNSNETNPKKVGELVTFNIDWTDIEKNNAKAFICDTDEISLSGCSNKIFCETITSKDSPLICNYQVEENDERLTEFWASTCDETGCSSPQKSQFYINHAPIAEIIQPNGNEIIDQAEGNYSILFNLFDKDQDELFGEIYYGETKGEKTKAIKENINFSKFCSDVDYDPRTPLECNFPWDSSGIFGNYYLTISANDSFEEYSISNENSFNVTSLVDINPPQIISDWLSESEITSGEEIIIHANAIDPNMKNVWAIIDTIPETKIILNENQQYFYSGEWIAEKIGNYSYKIFAEDIVGNKESSVARNFTITKPTLTHLNQNLPTSAMPNHVIQINADMKSQEQLRNVHAFLEVPEGFIFLKDYPQNTVLGNFSADETKTARWFLSTPLEEKNYNLKIIYSDQFYNSWDSNNFNLGVSSSSATHELELEGYPQVETSNRYFAKSLFKENNKEINPDSMQISLFDPAGQLTIGPVPMTNIKTGKFNFSHLLGASATEGQWETKVNATKNGISYYKNQYWRLIGGPFDVRDIRIDNSEKSNLQISVTTENTGGANKDMILVWNLTRMDTGRMLDSASETFMVPGNSEKNWTIKPNTNYTGQVKISMIGYYGFDFSEKAGAYKIFSTTADSSEPDKPHSGSSGGSSKRDNEIKIENKIEVTTNETIILIRGQEKNIPLTIKNIGNSPLKNIILELEGLSLEDYFISPATKDVLNPNEETIFNIKFQTSKDLENKFFNYVIKSDELTNKIAAKIETIKIENYLKNKINLLQQKLISLNQLFKDYPEVSRLKECQSTLDNANNLLNSQEFQKTETKIEETNKCINNAVEILKNPNKKTELNSIFWAITWVLILGLIITLIYLIKRMKGFYILQKISQKKTTKTKPQKKESFDEKIQSIQNRLDNLEF